MPDQEAHFHRGRILESKNGNEKGNDAHDDGIQHKSTSFPSESMWDKPCVMFYYTVFWEEKEGAAAPGVQRPFLTGYMLFLYPVFRSTWFSRDSPAR